MLYSQYDQGDIIGDKKLLQQAFELYLTLFNTTRSFARNCD